MNMRHWSWILMYVVINVHSNLCQTFPLESARYSHSRNATQNMCLKVESDILYPHVPGNGYRSSENDIADMIKRKFINLAGMKLKSEARKDELHDDPNFIQALMSRAFIDNANFAFHKSDVKDDDSFANKHVFQISKYPKLKFDFDKSIHLNPRRKREIKERVPNTEESDDLDDNYSDIKPKSRNHDDSETRVHCVRAGPSEVVCRHENYSFNFKLPPDLFDKKVMENLVSSVCTIIEEASPNGKGKVEISVKKKSKSWKKVIDNYDEKSEQSEPKEDTEKVINKVIRINIPIDFSAIPLGSEDEDKTLSDRSDYVKESKQNENGENPTIFDKSQDQLVKESKLQLIKNDDNHGTNTDKETDAQAFVRANSLVNESKYEEGEKWLEKRDNLHDPMVFPPSLILFKRSPTKMVELSFDKENRINSTRCDDKTIELFP